MIFMEFLDVVNDEDEVIAYASIRDIYLKKLPYRFVHILVFNDKGELALTKKEEKDGAGAGWCSSVSGHVLQKESYKDAAKRKCKEELGFEPELEEVKKEVYAMPDGSKKFLTVFRTELKDLSQISGKKNNLEFFSLDRIKEQSNAGEKFHPELLFLLKSILDLIFT